MEELRRRRSALRAERISSGPTSPTRGARRRFARGAARISSAGGGPSGGGRGYGAGGRVQCAKSGGVGAVDSLFPERPESHIYVRSVAAWETLPDDGLERYE